jgi:hypothetical protein
LSRKARFCARTESVGAGNEGEGAEGDEAGYIGLILLVAMKVRVKRGWKLKLQIKGRKCSKPHTSTSNSVTFSFSEIEDLIVIIIK